MKDVEHLPKYEFGRVYFHEDVCGLKEVLDVPLLDSTAERFCRAFFCDFSCEFRPAKSCDMVYVYVLGRVFGLATVSKQTCTSIQFLLKCPEVAIAQCLHKAKEYAGKALAFYANSGERLFAGDLVVLAEDGKAYAYRPKTAVKHPVGFAAADVELGEEVRISPNMPLKFVFGNKIRLYE